MSATTPRIAAIMFCSLIASGCGALTGTGDDRTELPASCSGNVPITVVVPASSTTPVFDWSPRCGVSSLVVTTVPPMGAAPAQMWAIRSPENKPFGPPVAFGAMPRSAVGNDAVALTRGVTYKVSILQTLGLDAVVGGGEATFAIP